MKMTKQELFATYSDATESIDYQIKILYFALTTLKDTADHKDLKQLVQLGSKDFITANNEDLYNRLYRNLVSYFNQINLYLNNTDIDIEFRKMRKMKEAVNEANSEEFRRLYKWYYDYQDTARKIVQDMKDFIGKKYLKNLKLNLAEGLKVAKDKDKPAREKQDGQDLVIRNLHELYTDKYLDNKLNDLLVLTNLYTAKTIDDI